MILGKYLFTTPWGGLRPSFYGAGTFFVLHSTVHMAKTMIGKSLCKNMTDFKTIMFFDRETVYKTQNPLDSISFVKYILQSHNNFLLFLCMVLSTQSMTLLKSAPHHKKG